MVREENRKSTQRAMVNYCDGQSGTDAVVVVAKECLGLRGRGKGQIGRAHV